MADGKIVIDTKVDSKGAEKDAKELESKLKNTAEKIGNAGENMSKFVTLPIMAVAGASMKAAADFQSAARIIQNGLGVTTEEAEKLREVANNIYKKGFGESLEETSKALVQVKQNFKNLIKDAELEQVTKDAIALANVLDEDVNWVTRAGSTLMREFGVSSKESFDLLAWGAQNGLNFSQEMLDNISEYGPLFAEMGYSAKEYFELLAKGTEEGAYNLDFINDVMKEFQIRVKDGSKSTSEAMEQLSGETQKVWKDFLSGKATVKDVANSVLEDLGQMDDKVMANQLGVALFGTKWEDLERDAVIALSEVTGELENVEGSMGKITKSQEESFGQKFKSLLRETMDSLVPLGETLIDIAEDIIPPVIKVLQTMANWFSDLPGPVKLLIVVIGGLIAVLGPLLAALGPIIMVLTTLSTATLGWIAAIGGIVIAVAAVVTLVIVYWDEIKAFTIAAWNAIVEFFKSAWELIKSIFTAALIAVSIYISNMWQSIKDTTSSIWNGIKNFFSYIWEVIKNAFNTTLNAIKNLITSIWNGIKTTTETVWNGIKTFIQNLWNGIKTLIQTAANTIKSIIESIWNGIKSVTSTVWNGIKSFFSSIWDGILGGVEKFKSAFLKVWEAIKSGIRAIVNPIAGIMNGLLSGIERVINGVAKAINSIPSIEIPDWVPGIGGKSFGLPKISTISLPRIPSLDVGTNFVAKDGLAFLHKGEAVVPKEYNPAADGRKVENQQQPANITLVLGDSEFSTFVDDITKTQERKKYRLYKGRRGGMMT